MVKTPAKSSKPVAATTDIKPSKSAALVKQVLSVLDQAKNFIIKTDAQFVQCGELIRTVKNMRAQVAAVHDPVVAHWHEKHKDALAEKKKDDAPLAEAEQILKQRWDSYDREQKRHRAEEEDRLRREAIREEEERRQREAQTLVEEGREEEAVELLTKDVGIEDVEVLPTSRPVKSEGISSRTTYHAEVTDLMKLVRAIAEGKVPVQAIEADMMFLNGQARLMQKAGELYPGVEVITGSSVTARR